MYVMKKITDIWIGITDMDMYGGNTCCQCTMGYDMHNVLLILMLTSRICECLFIYFLMERRQHANKIN